MGKAERLLTTLLQLPDRPHFTVAELAQDLGVSRRTALRYLHALSELGIPLAAQPGPGGGYRLIRDRVVPPVTFTVEEAVALFFAYRALARYRALPFRAEVESALRTLHNKLAPDAQRRISSLIDRVDFVVEEQPMAAPYLRAVLTAALDGRVVRVTYRSLRGEESRTLQPIGVYAENGFWYCPAYCFTRHAVRVFRVDRIMSLEPALDTEPLEDVRAITVHNFREHQASPDNDRLLMVVALSGEALRRFEHREGLQALEDGTGVWTLRIHRQDIPFFAHQFLGMGPEARVLEPPEVRQEMARLLTAMSRFYGTVETERGPDARSTPEQTPQALPSALVEVQSRKAPTRDG